MGEERQVSELMESTDLQTETVEREGHWNANGAKYLGQILDFLIGRHLFGCRPAARSANSRIRFVICAGSLGYAYGSCVIRTRKATAVHRGKKTRPAHGKQRGLVR